MAEFNLGTLSETPKAASNSVSNTDTSDLYSFSLDSSSNLNLTLTDISADADVDVNLYRDVNSDGVIDASDEFIIGSSYDNTDSLNPASLDAGEYLVEVNQLSGNTQYDLSLSTSSPNNLLSNEVEVGTLTGTQTFSRSFPETLDTADVFHFSLDTSSDFELSLTGLSGDADVQLIQDTNSNGIVDLDLGEVIGSSTSAGSTSESISAFLNAGDNYFVQVYQYNGSVTDCDLTLSV